MIIGGDKSAVVENIKKLANSGDLNHKAELFDPSLSEEESLKVIERYNVKRGKRISHFIVSRPAHFMHRFTQLRHRSHIEIDGLEKIKGIKGGAIITCNHFNPIDSIFPCYVARKAFHKFPWIVSQETNLAMPGLNGYLMNNLPLLPLKNSPNYIIKHFMPELKAKLKHGDLVLIYPEEEMWFNYRKPRPSKRGTFLFAAQANVPVIPCFVEMRPTDKKGNEQFYLLDYTIHVLDPIYPDKNKSNKENSVVMAKADYREKIAAYEAAFGEKLDYKFKYKDIAGYIRKH